MENYSYSSYPDSHDSSPRSREIDVENAGAWDEASYRVKFMCSYGGKISPRAHDNQLSYVGGDTKILTVDRNVRYSAMINKLSSLLESPPENISFKYQLPGEDLDALISVTNDEDLDHMMMEYDRLLRSSAKPARLRLFLFSVSSPAQPSPLPSAAPDRRWFVDALNSAPLQALDLDPPPPPPLSASPMAAAPDYLFGLEKSQAPVPVPVGVKVQQDPAPMTDRAVMEPAVAAAAAVNRSDLGKEERQIGAAIDPAVSAAEIQRQIQELQRMQIAGEFQRRSDEALPRVFHQDSFPPKPIEKPMPPVQAAAPVMQPPVSYWPERQMPAPGGFTAATGTEQPVYYLPTPVYRPPVAGQGYYVYRDPSPMYGAPAPAPPAAQKVGQYTEGVVRPTAAYDSSGRQMFYNTPGGMVPAYQTVAGTTVDVRHVALGQDAGGKVVRPPMSS